MKTYYVYWTPQKHMYAKVQAETPEDAFKAIAGNLKDYTKAHIVYIDVEDEGFVQYDVFEDKNPEPVGTFIE